MLGMYVCNWGLEEGLLEVLASEFTEAPKAKTIVVHESYITKSAHEEFAKARMWLGCLAATILQHRFVFEVNNNPSTFLRTKSCVV